MEKTISNQIRENLLKRLQCCLNSCCSLDEFTVIYEQFIYFELERSKNPIQKIYTYMELAVAFSDLYKLCIYKRNQNELTVEDYFYLSEIDDINDLEDVIVSASAAPIFLERMIKASLEFNELSFLGKETVMMSLNEDDHNYLSGIANCHEMDKEIYLREIELTDYINHFETEAKRINQEENYYVMADHFTEEICSFLTNLSKYNYENFANNIKDLLIFYYEYGKYTIDHNKQIMQGSEEDIQSIVSLFEKMNIEDIIQESLYNHDLLFCIVDFYLNTYPLKKICYADEQVPYQKVEKYMETITDEKIKQKLDYKKTRI
jgi:hypothetical protein